MQRNAQSLMNRMAIAVVLTVLSGVPLGAQQAPPPAGRTQTRPAAEVLTQIGRSAGAIVLADSTIFARLPAPAVAATPETLEQQIAEMVRALPAGTTVIKLYAPTPASGRWNADAVADYARAQARLVGSAGRPAPAGMVEIFGRHVPRAEAEAHAAALNLRRVYLVTNPHAPNVAGAAANWSALTPEQREGYVQQQVQRLMALDPAARFEAMRELMRDPGPQQRVLRGVMTQMPEAERRDLRMSLDRAVDEEKKAAIGK